jgi:hypothetical protein
MPPLAMKYSVIRKINEKEKRRKGEKEKKKT